MKVLLLYDYPPPPGGLATQGDLLYRGLREIGVEAMATHVESDLEKEWAYRVFKPDIVVGIGYWGHIPQIVLHPQRFGLLAVPWLVADGYIANYRQVLNDLPLILVTSNWVKEVYVRDGIRGEPIEVLPVGCDTDQFIPRSSSEPEVAAIRQIYGIGPEQLMILTIGGDAASKGAQEVMKALASLEEKVPLAGNNRGSSDRSKEGSPLPAPAHPVPALQEPALPVTGLPVQDWKYICKVWPQDRTLRQNELDRELAQHLGIAGQVVFSMDRVTRRLMPYLYAACDIYAAPSRLEGFGMPQVEAGACGKPVIGIAAMAMLDTLVHGETALLAGVAEEHYIDEAVVGQESGYPEGTHIPFNTPRIADYRADVGDIRRYLQDLMRDPALRQKLGQAGRQRVVEHFDYRVVATRFVEIVSQRLGIG